MKYPSGTPFASLEARFRRRIRQRKQPVQSRSQATTEALLEATLQVLVREGFSRLTTTRVADRAGVSVGTLYQYFPDKRSLVTALKVRYFGLMVQAVDRALAEAGGLDLEERLRRALRALLSVKREHLELTKALREPMAEVSGHSFMREASLQFVAVFVPHLSSALPGLAEVERRTALLVAALEGAISHAVYESPSWLAEPWFLEDLVGLAAAYLRSARGRSASG
ncbi:MAG: TetR/AcrR family transcriptional regulator [Myxococcales bacterium]